MTLDCSLLLSSLCFTLICKWHTIFCTIVSHLVQVSDFSLLFFLFYFFFWFSFTLLYSTLNLTNLTSWEQHDIDSTANPKYSPFSSVPFLHSLYFLYVITDSDITDVQFDGFSQRKQFTLLSNYSINLEYVVKTIIDSKKWVAIASPCGVLLEVPYFGPPTSARFHNKEGAINKYTTATVLVTEKMKIPYIDIRNPFLDAIPLYRLGYKGKSYFLVQNMFILIDWSFLMG